LRALASPTSLITAAYKTEKQIERGRNREGIYLKYGTKRLVEEVIV